MNLLLTTKCLSKCKFCFVPKELKTKQSEMSFVQFKRCIDHINVLFKDKKPVVGILGGEPTLAKDFPMIAGYAKSYSGGIRLYSNLITDRKNIEYLYGAGNIVLVWNAGSYLQAGKKNKKIMLRNLGLICSNIGGKVAASITLYPDFKDEDFNDVVKILKKYDITNVRAALDSTRHREFLILGGKVFGFIKHLKNLHFNVYTSYCGHFIRGMFTPSQEKYLKKNVFNFNYNDCSDNYPLDILPDGRVIPCVGFANTGNNLDFLSFNKLAVLKNEIKRKFELKNADKKFCMAGGSRKRSFKIITGFGPSDKIDYLADNGIKEVYCGYYDKESEKKWPAAFGCVNRRGEGVNFFGWEKLTGFSKRAHKKGIKVFVTLNSHYYVSEQYGWLKKTVKRIVNEKSVAGVIVNDIGLLIMLKKMKFGKDITISTLATAFNSKSVEFYKSFGANRIVLDRQMECDEIIGIARKHTDMNFEVFVISTGGCLFIDGYCSLFHCFEKVKNKSKFSGIAKAEKYDVETPGAGCCTVLNSFENGQFKQNLKRGFNMAKTLGFACNICMLYKLKDIPNISLKIDNRGANGSGVTGAAMLKDLTEAVNLSGSGSVYAGRAKAILYKHKRVKCSPEICLYHGDKDA